MWKPKLVILRNEVDDDHILWEKACEAMQESIDWKVIDITKSNWLEQTVNERADGLLAVPSGYTTPFRILYDERVTILKTICGIPVFPGLEEISIFENKKFLSYWLAANKIPHPKTWVFYFEKEAMDFLNISSFPLVAKTNIGAGGNGVLILNSQTEAEKYIKDTFSGKGIKQKVGPKWAKKGFATRVFKKLLHPGELKLKMSKYRMLNSERQTDYVIFQEYIPHSYEWRCVRIGDSFFAHKKLKVQDKASGSLLKGYETPPFDLLDFVKQITDKRNFLSQAADIFIGKDGTYLVNELQCLFGQSDPYQMLIDGVPGRYCYKNSRWVFEPGDFNRFESHLLRLETFIDILKKNKAAEITR
jgi:Phosphoribosylglycinamide synthetase, ATP-grasp (A) domain